MLRYGTAGSGAASRGGRATSACSGGRGLCSAHAGRLSSAAVAAEGQPGCPARGCWRLRLRNASAEQVRLRF